MNQAIKVIVGFGLVLATWLGLPSICQAQLFEFVQDGTGDVLATLEVLNLPADELSDFGDLTFTADGDAIFGLGVGVYGGTFDRGPINGYSVGVLGDGSLGCVECLADGDGTGLVDTDPPGGTQRISVAVGFRRGAPDIIESVIFTQGIVVVDGRWTPAVPEPSSAILLGLCGVLGVLRRKR